MSWWKFSRTDIRDCLVLLFTVVWCCTFVYRYAYRVGFRNGVQHQAPTTTPAAH